MMRMCLLFCVGRDTAESMSRPAGNMRVQIDVKELEPRVAGPHVERATVAKHHWHQPEQTSDNYQLQHERLRDVVDREDRARPLRLVVKSKRRLS